MSFVIYFINKEIETGELPVPQSGVTRMYEIATANVTFSVIAEALHIACAYITETNVRGIN